MDRVKESAGVAATGAAMGLAFFGAEEVLHHALRHPHLRAGELLLLLPLYLLLPAAAGFGLGMAGFRSIAAALWIWAVLTGLVLLGPVVGWIGWAGAVLVFGVPVAAVIGLLYRTRESSEGVRWGGLVGALAWTLFFGVINSSVLVDPLSGLGLGVNAALALMAVLAGLAVGKALKDRAPKAGVWAALAAVPLWIAVFALPSPHSPDLPPASKGADAEPIVLVVVDGLRADQVSWFGSAHETTPNLDALAEDSYAYIAQTASPNALSSAASILTGANPSRHEAIDAPLGPGKRTLTEYAQEQGFVTGAVVSRLAYAPGTGLDQGFAYYERVAGLGHLPLLLQTLDVVGLGLFQPREFGQADRVTDRALEFVQSRGKQPWFLMVQYSDLMGPDPAASLVALDREIGRLDRSLPDDAWLVVMGSYGRALDTEPVLSQGSLAVPVLVFRPRNLKPSTVVRTVRTTDVMPTLLDLMDTRARTRIDGELLFEVFGRDGPDAPSVALSEDGAGAMAAVLDEWKLVLQDGAPTALYNLGMDPQEQDNVLDSQAPAAAALLAKVPGFEPGSSLHDSLDPAIRERIDGLYDATAPEQPQDAPEGPETAPE